MSDGPRMHLVGSEDPGRELASGGGGNGGRYNRLDERLRAVENDITEIKTRIEDLATKKDITVAIQSLKLWAMGGGLIGGMAVIGWLVFWLLNAGGRIPGRLIPAPARQQSRIPDRASLRALRGRVDSCTINVRFRPEST